MNVIYFLRSICKEKISVYIIKRCREIGQRFEEILRGRMFVKNLEIFLINSSHHIQPYSIIDEYTDLAKHAVKRNIYSILNHSPESDRLEKVWLIHFVTRLAHPLQRSM